MIQSLKSKSSLNFKTFFRLNYQLLWEQQDQQAYINFPQIFTETELLPYIIKNENKHLQYRNPTSLNITFFQQINLDNNYTTDYFETSENRPYFTSHISPETTPKNKFLMSYLNIQDNIPFNQKNKKTLIIFFKTNNLIK